MPPHVSYWCAVSNAKQLNREIFDSAVQQFLIAHQNEDAHRVALMKSPFDEVSARELAGQIDARQRCKYKLPTWYGTQGIYYPSRLAVEQSSSELAAEYKAALIPVGAKVLDMTGGMGVDSYFFTKRASEVQYMERDGELATIVQHNASILDVTTIRFDQGDSVAHVKLTAPDTYDLIYLDPARRSGTKKVFLFEDCEPDVIQLQEVMLEKARHVLIKAAPMLDIQAAASSLQHLKEVHVLSIDGECKELLFLMERDFAGEMQIIATTLDRTGKNKKLIFKPQEEQQAQSVFAAPQGYIYEPDAALLKAGAFKFTGQHFGLAKLHQHTHLYTSDQVLPDFPGKISAIQEVIPFAVFKKIKKQSRDSNTATAGNVITRNFPNRPEELRKKHGIKELQGSNLYFCTDLNGALIVVSCQTVITAPSH